MATLHEFVMRRREIRIQVCGKKAMKNKAARRELVAEAVRDYFMAWPTSHDDRPSLDFRLWAGSGRAADWNDSGFRYAAAIIRQLTTDEGYKPDEARRIAKALTYEKVTDAPPPPSVGVEETLEYVRGRYRGWQARMVNWAKAAWAVWTARERPKAAFGKRTRRWQAVVDRLAAEKRAAAWAKLQAWYGQHLESLTPELRALQLTARCGCIHLSKDGQTVTEFLHDVGGSMSSTVGCNGFVMPATLADMQRQHDTVYHPAEAAGVE